MSFFRSRIDLSLNRRIFRLAYPVMTAMVSQTLINQVDHILIGHLPRVEATPGQLAVQIGQIFLWMFGGCLSALAIGTQSLVARRVGEESDQEAGAIASNSFFLALCGSIVLTLVCYLLAPVLFRLMSDDVDVNRIGVPFLRLRFLQLGGMVMAACYKAFFDALGRTKVYMVAALLANTLNLVICVAFIFGSQRPGIAGIDQLHQFLWWATGEKLPRMGVSGAGLASLISSYMILGIVMLWSLRRRYASYGLYRLRNISRKISMQIVKISLPSALATLFAMVGFGFAIIVAEKSDVLAHHPTGRTIFGTATSNMISILMLVFITCMGYGTAVATLVSQNLGAKRFELAEKYVYTAALSGVCIFAALGGLMAWGAKAILHFWNPDAEVIAVALPILRLMCLLEPMMFLAVLFTAALNGAGNTKYVMMVEIVLHFTCLMPLCYLLGITLGFGLWGVWISLMVYIVGLALSMAAKFGTNTWKSIKL